MEKMTIEESIIENGYYAATVKGDSMMPLLRQNIDIVKIVKADEIKENDILLYKRPTGEYVLHRVIKIDDDCYVTCGDNRFQKENVPKSWAVGVAGSIFRGEEEIDLTDARYEKYVQRIRKTYWYRRIKHKMRRIFHR